MARAFTPLDIFEPVYTGGLVQPAAGGGALACLCGEDVVLVDLATGRARSRVPGEGDVLTCFALRPDGLALVTAGRSLTLRAWDVGAPTPSAGRGWKAPHRAPVAHMAYDSTGTLVATGSADRAVFVHDVSRGYVTHALRAHGAPVTCVAFHPDARRLELLSAASDGAILVWHLAGGDGAGAVAARLDAHVGAPTSLAFSPDGQTLVSGGRDRVAVVWDLRAKKATRTIATREALEGVACAVAAAGGAGAGGAPLLLALTAGESGVVRAWDVASGRCVAGGGAKAGEAPPLLGLALLPSPDGRGRRVLRWDVEFSLGLRPLAALLAEGAEHGGAAPPRRRTPAPTSASPPAEWLSAPPSQEKVLAGSFDEIVDVRFLGPSPIPPAAPPTSAPTPTAALTTTPALPDAPPPSASPLLVVATNSAQLRLLCVASRACAHLRGHTDIVLAIDVSADGQWIGSASKDCSVRLWCARTGAAVGVGVGHAEPVAALGFCARSGDLFSGSRDKTLKRWDAGRAAKAWAAAAAKGEWAAQPLRARASVVAHAKEVNGLALAPTGGQLVTASQDKTLRVWRLGGVGAAGGAGAAGDGGATTGGGFELQGPLTGHRRAVWAVAVSPYERVCASASADCTVRVWSLADLACLRTLEGHAGPVLRVAWLLLGTQLASASSDGLVKIWTAKVRPRPRASDARASGPPLPRDAPACRRAGPSAAGAFFTVS